MHSSWRISFIRSIGILSVNVHVISTIHNANCVSIHRKSSAIDGFKSKDSFAHGFHSVLLACGLGGCLSQTVSLFIVMSFKIRLLFVFHHLIQIQFAVRIVLKDYTRCTKCTRVWNYTGNFIINIHIFLLLYLSPSQVNLSHLAWIFHKHNWDAKRTTFTYTHVLVFCSAYFSISLISVWYWFYLTHNNAQFSRKCFRFWLSISLSRSFSRIRSSGDGVCVQRWSTFGECVIVGFVEYK